jgi:hypothetical protein
VQAVTVSIVRFVDETQPGWVECKLVDAQGRAHRFVEKIPVVSSEDLRAHTALPRPGIIACKIVGQRVDDPDVVTVDTSDPWGTESTEGQTRFEVRRSDLVEV